MLVERHYVESLSKGPHEAQGDLVGEGDRVATNDFDRVELFLSNEEG